MQFTLSSSSLFTPTADIDKITSWSNTWNMFFNPDLISRSHYVSPKGPFRNVSRENPPSTFSTILWKKSFHSSLWVSLSAMIFPGKGTSPSWPPKPFTNWESPIVQSPSLAHLSS